jgi:hypothetical protein
MVDMAVSVLCHQQKQCNENYCDSHNNKVTGGINHQAASVHHSITIKGFHEYLPKPFKDRKRMEREIMIGMGRE